MGESPDSRSYFHDLEARVKHLEEVNRWTMDALDLVVSLGGLQADVKSALNPSKIFSLTRQYLSRLMSFQTTAFMMVSEADQHGKQGG